MKDNDAFATGIAVILKELGERQSRLGLHDVREQLTTEASLLRRSVVRQIQQHGVQSIEIDATGVPTGVEVTRFVLASDEAAIQPDPLAASFGEQLDYLRQTVEETATDFVPAEPLDNLVPRRDMLSRRQSAAVWIE